VRIRYDIQLNRGDFLARDRDEIWTVGDREAVAGFRSGLGGDARWRLAPLPGESSLVLS
jgi:hypothetical protein